MKNKILLLIVIFSLIGCHKRTFKDPKTYEYYDAIKIGVIRFEPAHPTIKGAGYSDLVRSISEMKKDSLSDFVIEGYANTYKNDSDNVVLASQRAWIVLKYAVGYGFNEKRFAIRSFASERKDTLGNRVEVRVLVSKDLNKNRFNMKLFPSSK